MCHFREIKYPLIFSKRILKMRYVIDQTMKIKQKEPQLSWMPVPFAPMGAFMTGLGMIIVGLASIKVKVWTGWKRYIPLMVGCFPFVFMFPLLIITGARTPAMIGLWGFPWIAMAVAAWQRSNEED